MILDDKQIKSITKDGVYECLLSKQKFSTAFFEEPSPLGSIIVFQSPLTIGPISFDSCLTVCAELPNTNIFGGVCFQRLFVAQLGSILSNFLEKTCYVNENCLFVEDTQASITVVNQLKSSIMIHIFLPINTKENQGLFQLNIDQEKLEQFKAHCINCFNQLTKSLFLETQRDNI